MDQDIFDEDVDELTLISNEFKNIASSRKKEGYKEGMERGQHVNMQQGFDQGFKEGFACTVLMSKVKGILNGLLEFHRLYDGNPISDGIALEAQLVIDSIDELETDHIIGDLLELKLSPSNQNEGCNGNCTCGNNNNDNDDDMEVNMDMMQLNDEAATCHETQENKSKLTIGNRSIELKTLDPRQMERMIESADEVQKILNRCQKVLNKLGWHDELYNLLSVD